MISLYTVKLEIVSGNDMGPGVVQTNKKHVHVVGFFEQHISGNNMYLFFCKKI